MAWVYANRTGSLGSSRESSQTGSPPVTRESSLIGRAPVRRESSLGGRPPVTLESSQIGRPPATRESSLRGRPPASREPGLRVLPATLPRRDPPQGHSKRDPPQNHPRMTPPQDHLRRDPLQDPRRLPLLVQPQDDLGSMRRREWGRKLPGFQHQTEDTDDLTIVEPHPYPPAPPSTPGDYVTPQPSPALPPALYEATKAALWKTYESARERGQEASLCLQTRRGRETVVFSSRDQTVQIKSRTKVSETPSCLGFDEERREDEGRREEREAAEKMFRKDYYCYMAPGREEGGLYE